MIIKTESINNIIAIKIEKIKPFDKDDIIPTILIIKATRYADKN